MKKSIIVLLIIVSLLTSILSGCSRGNKKNPLQKDENGVTTFTVLSSAVIGGTQWGDDPVSRAITEKTGIAFNIEYAIGDFDEKLATLMASGNYPDIILSIDNYQINDLIDAKALVPIDDYLVDGGENIKAVFGDKLGAMESSDGHIYGVNKDFGGISATRDWYVQVQYKVLEEFGYPKIDTLPELGDLLEQYIDKYKTYNGNPLIGILSPAGGDALRHGINNTAMRTAGFQDDGEFYIDPETIEATYAMVMPQTKEYMLWLNDMYQRGIFSIDSFTFDHNAVEQEIAKGNVLCVTSPEWAIGQAEKALKSVAGTPELCYAKLPIYINEEAKENSQVSNYDSMGTWKSVITTSCADPELAFKFFDQMWSEEMQVLVNWGVEGEHYTVQDGIRTLLPDIANKQRNDADARIKTGIGLYNYWSVGEMVKDSTGQYINPFVTPETIAESYSEKDKEVIHAYDPEAHIWADLWPEGKPSPWGFTWKLSLPRGEGAKAQTKIKEEINPKYMLDLVRAKDKTEFDQIWQEYVDLCYEEGIALREDEVTEALKKRMLDWYGE